MRSDVKLGSISGVEIGLYYGCFIVAAFAAGEHFHQVRQRG
jgi:hypothetical protein